MADDRELLLELGIAALAAGRPVHEVEREVRLVGGRLGSPDVRSAATPTGIFVSLGPSESAGFAATGPMVRFDQITRLEQITDDLLDGRIDAEHALREVRAVRAAPARLPRTVRALTLLPQAAGVALVLQPTVASALVAMVAALAVAGLDLLSDRVNVLKQLMPVLAAFAAGCVVFAASRLGLLDAPLRTALAPIAILLPGALIVTGLSEMAAGAMVAGAARLLFGAVQILLLCFGLFMAARVLGVTQDDLQNVRIDQLGGVGLVVGLLLVGGGIHLDLSSPRGVLPWMLLMLGVTCAVQVAGQHWGGAAVGGFFGGLTAALGSVIVHLLPARPPRLATFLPAFWLLVPGSLGVLTATEFASGQLSGLPTLIEALASVVAIALGVLVGSALGDALRARVAARRDGASAPAP